jgi:crotonobetainyl-CoA:carnitine CoA-transferase CaiB-like acyl-CoA transferase
VALAGVRVVSIAVNIPGPAAASRLSALGASVTKVEPPTGDPLAQAFPGYYTELLGEQEVARLNLKAEEGRAQLHALLADSDLLLTSHRGSALARLELEWPVLHTRHPRLSQVALVGHPAPEADRPGHDLTYQAAQGLLTTGRDEHPRLPTVLVADLVGAERAATEALAALVERGRTGEGTYREVALSVAAAVMAAPLRHGLTRPGGALGGALPAYRIYAAREGHVACAALEPHFFARLCELLGVDGSHHELEAVFGIRSASEWEAWAREHDLPLVAVVRG